MNNFTVDRTVGEIVADDYRTAGIFKQFGLDFCCGGGRTLTEACQKKGINVDIIIEELNGLSSSGTAMHNYKSWSPGFLVDYIINNHHHYVRTKLPEIKAYAKKVAKVHGKSYPELQEMLDLFLELKDEMLSHLEKEEKILFPYIKKLAKMNAEGRSGARELQFESPEEAIAMLEDEHETAGDIMLQLKILSNSFTPPKDACTTFRVYFQNLQAFQDDLHKHVHLENNILFPKVLQMMKAEQQAT